MTSLALLFTLASVGISETVYLIRKRITAEQPVCPIGTGCEEVLGSNYNRIFIIHSDILGLLAYIIISIISALMVIGTAPVLWSLLLKILVGIASLVSLFFTYLQWQVIKIWCFWCLMSAFTIWLMQIIILLSKTI
ncbi:hypothetical protein HYW73_03740 [Candidatus Nomurabacteria bacterium]|nr:hypothetical protein [Candidatus Nomurabacteria bacterium]